MSYDLFISEFSTQFPFDDDSKTISSRKLISKEAEQT